MPRCRKFLCWVQHLWCSSQHSSQRVQGRRFWLPPLHFTSRWCKRTWRLPKKEICFNQVPLNKFFLVCVEETVKKGKYLLAVAGVYLEPQTSGWWEAESWGTNILCHLGAVRSACSDLPHWLRVLVPVDNYTCFSFWHWGWQIRFFSYSAVAAMCYLHDI